MLVTATALWGLGVAHAAVYVGTFDPQYGSPFTVTEGARVDLGWSGEIRLDLDDVCVVANGDVNVGVGCGVSVDYAFAVLYDIANVADNFTLNFDPLSVDVETLRFSGGNLVGLQTGFFSNFVGDGGFAYDYTDEILFGLRFVLDDVVDYDSDDNPILYSGPLLPWARGTGPCVPGEPCGSPDVVSFPPDLVFTLIPPNTVPLPATPALVLLALAAAAVVRRR